MSRDHVLRLLSATPLLLGIAACTPCCTQDCPAIYLIDGDIDATDRFNILIVGDGFRTSSQLESFRAAAEQLVEGFRLEPPFDTASFSNANPSVLYDSINFYRIDVLDDTPVANACQFDAQPCDTNLGDCGEQQLPCEIEELVEGIASGFVPTPTVDPPIVTGSGRLERDLKLRLCYAGAQTCNSLGIPRAARHELFKIIGRNGPSFDTVVVIGNARNVAGGASFRVGGETAIAFVGVPLMEQDGIWRVSPEAITLFAHEVAHTIGLYDEYGGAGGNYPPLEPGRNVWKLDGANFTPTTFAQTLMPVPWQELMQCNHPVETPLECRGIPVETSPCQPLVNTNCVFVPASSPHCQPSLECDRNAGLWEGAYYHNTGYYRSHRYCQMERLGVEFCEACQLALRRLLCCYGDGICDLCPYPITN